MLAAAWNTGGFALAVVSLGVSLGAWVFPMQQGASVSLRSVLIIMLPVGLLTAVGLIVLTRVMLEVHDELATTKRELDRARRAQAGLPRVLRALDWGDGRLVCLLEQSALFAHGVVVSFYLREPDGLERRVAIGRVLNVQQDGLIQAEVLKTAKGCDEVIKAVWKDHKTTVDRLLVRPTVLHEELLADEEV